MKKAHKFSPDEDAPLLLSWHRGDISAFETLVWKYLKRVFSLAFYLTGNSEKAVAATQGAFIAAFVNINTFNSRYHFSNWLIALTLKEAREQLGESGSASSKAVARDSGNHEQLTAQLRQLPVELAEILVLRYVRGYPLERLAEIYGLRSDVLVARLFAAHEMLASKGEAFPGQFLTGGEDKNALHPEIRLSFHAYLDSGLSREEADKIKKHLKSCGSCREALTQLEWMIGHLNTLPDVDPPPWLSAAILQNVKTSSISPVSERKKSPAQYLQLAIGLMFVVVLGISAYLLLHEQGNRSVPVTGIEAESKLDRVSVQPPQQSKPAGAVTSVTAPDRSPGMPFAPPGRMAAPSGAPVPLPPGAPPAVPSPDLAVFPESNSAAAPVKSEAAGKRDRVTRSPELPHGWGESLPTPGPHDK